MIDERGAISRVWALALVYYMIHREKGREAKEIGDEALPI